MKNGYYTTQELESAVYPVPVTPQPGELARHYHCETPMRARGRGCGSNTLKIQGETMAKFGKPDRKRRWRVSVYATADADPASAPIKHHASRKKEIAALHFQKYAEQMKTGKVGRVIMHQGNLKRESYYLEDDTAWIPTRWK